VNKPAASELVSELAADPVSLNLTDGETAHYLERCPDAFAARVRRFIFIDPLGE